MRYDVKKFLFVGVEKDKDLFFKRAQELGIIHFIPGGPCTVGESAEAVASLVKSMKILRGLPVAEQEETEEYEIADGLAHKILELKKHIDELEEEERITALDMSRVQIFGNFSLEDIAAIQKDTKRVVQFYCSKRGIAEHLELPDEVLFVGSDHDLDYFVGINKTPTQYPKLVEMVVDKPYGMLRERYDAVRKEIAECEERLKGYAKYNTMLHHAYVYKLNNYQLDKAKDCVNYPITEDSLFVVQGWVPVNKINELHKLVEEMRVHYEEVVIEPHDPVPTCLENTGYARVGEDLVHIYDTPSMTDKDPSLWVLFFFALFFSMVIGDGGYGLILLLIAVYVRYKFGALKGWKKRSLTLLTILSFACIVWGVLTTSFFGITVAPDSPLRKVSVMSWLVEKKAAYHIEKQDETFKSWVKEFPDLANVKDPVEFLTKAQKTSPNGRVSYEAYSKFSDNIMLELALFVGVLHLIISMTRYLDRNWSNLGWIILLIGAYLYTPFFLGATSMIHFVLGLDPAKAAHNGLYMIYGGFALAVVIALFRHKLFGLIEATNIIQIFGDVLSYLRLYALGLAGAMLTATMLDLAAGVPFVFSVLILVFGHLVNIVLSIMGGVIHGLRLNFLEWYHYCFEGGGKVFNPLKKHEIE